MGRWTCHLDDPDDPNSTITQYCRYNLQTACRQNGGDWTVTECANGDCWLGMAIQGECTCDAVNDCTELCDTGVFEFEEDGTITEHVDCPIVTDYSQCVGCL